jgi:glycosyltransferase involved in cell wall biosynthesis
MPDPDIAPSRPNVALSIVMPAFNEGAILAASVDEVCEGLRKRELDFEIIVVENGSTDGTLELARQLVDDHPELRVESLPTADYGAALRHGLLQARGDAVVNFDTDYYDLDFLDESLARLLGANGPAVVVGSKRARGSDDTRSLPRRLVTAVFSTILRVGYGLKVSDTHGMKAMRRAAVVDLARACVLGRDLFDTELILRVERAGLATDEIPVAVEERRPARTPIMRRVPGTLMGLLRMRGALRGNGR